MILHIRITEESEPVEMDGVERRGQIEHYHRRVELSDAEAVARIGRALDAELGRPARRQRSDKGTTRGATT